MSAERIDVRVRLIASRLRDAQRMNSRSKEVYADQLDSIAAAVAELIETGEPVAQKMEQEDYPEWPDDARVEVVLTLGEMRRFRAALARVSGGAP